MFKITSSVLIGALCLGAFTASEVSAKSYKGAEIYNSNATKYGRYVMRMKMAKGSGVLSTYFTYKDGSEVSGAFWEEIDIEVLGKNDAFQMQSNIISGNSPRVTTEALHTIGASLGDAYHTYTLEWTPDYVSWSIDGQEVRKINGGSFVSSLTSPQSMRFNIWASTSESWVGAFNPTILPVYQFVNYMEYYSYNTSSRTFNLAWRDDFNSFDSSRWAKADWTFDGNYVDFDPANVVVQNGTLILALTNENNKGFSGTVPVDGGTSSSSSVRSSSSSVVASSVRSSSLASSIRSSVASSSVVSSSSSVSTGGQCNWYGTLYPLCTNTSSGWGYENNKSCITRSTCAGQPAPFGVVGGTSQSSVVASSARSSVVSSVASSSPSSSSVASSVVSSVASSSSSSVANTGGLACTVTVSNNWGNGYQVDVSVKNGGSTTVNGWNVSVTFGESPMRTGGWNAVFGGSGNVVTASNVNWNGTLAPNQSASFGLQGNHDGSFITPTCKVN